MISDKQTSLSPIISSKNGVHLTCYLENHHQDLGHLKVQLRGFIANAKEFLDPVFSADETKKFLEPLKGLLGDARILAKMKNNVGLFRTMDSFRVLNIPVEVEKCCVVASTFHVKPLLRWLQVDKEFLLLGIDQSFVHLYHGSNQSLVRVDSVRRERQSKFNNTFTWIHDWLQGIPLINKPKLFVAGEKSLTESFIKGLKYKNSVRQPISPSYSEAKVHDIALQIRRKLKSEVNLKLESTFLEFKLAEEMKAIEKNIFNIAKAAIQGRVRKLLVADGIQIFGKIDQKTGRLAIHPFDIDHEDDDVLDDLAQTVISYGGEVVVAAQHEMPKGRPIIALLDKENRLEQKTSSFERDNQERRIV